MSGRVEDIKRRAFLGVAGAAGIGWPIWDIHERRMETERKVEQVRNRFEDEEVREKLRGNEPELLDFAGTEINPTYEGITAELYLEMETEDIEVKIPYFLRTGEQLNKIGEGLGALIDDLGTEEPLDAYRAVFMARPGTVQYSISTDEVEKLLEQHPPEEIYPRTVDDNLDVYLL